jgi:hypothetical protein
MRKMVCSDRERTKTQESSSSVDSGKLRTIILEGSDALNDFLDDSPKDGASRSFLCPMRRSDEAMRLDTMKKFFRANAGLVFVSCFQIGLISAAALLAEGDASTASEVAAYAVYALLFAVTFEAVAGFRTRKQGTLGQSESASSPTS